MKCRHCGELLETTFIDLGFAPPSNAYLSKGDLDLPEINFPLKIYVCSNCWLVQTHDYAEVDELFSKDYAYFSSTSRSWLKHAKDYCEDISEFLNLNKSSFVIEVASNDGYLLKNFVAKGVPCLGIEPTKSTAEASEQIGVPTLQEFFGVNLAKKIAQEQGCADLIIGNNVYAHVPDINDFTLGLKIALKEGGVINLEFPHLMRLIDGVQFDTIYHEHFSYLSLTTVSKIFSSAGLKVFKVEELPTHGGSLRIYGCHVGDSRSVDPSVNEILQIEKNFGLSDIKSYIGFTEKVNKLKDDFLLFLIEQKRLGKVIAGYGAAAKGNTLMNYAGIKTDLIDFICDAAESKQNKFTPGSHIPIVSPGALLRAKPDWIIIFPWNIANEVILQLEEVKTWGGKFVIAVPEIKFLS